MLNPVNLLNCQTFVIKCASFCSVCDSSDSFVQRLEHEHFDVWKALSHPLMTVIMIKNHIRKNIFQKPHKQPSPYPLQAFSPIISGPDLLTMHVTCPWPRFALSSRVLSADTSHFFALVSASVTLPLSICPSNCLNGAKTWYSHLKVRWNSSKRDLCGAVVVLDFIWHAKPTTIS